MAPATTSVPSLPSPCPKSPREYPDLYGKRREMAKVQMLEREIGFLEEELKSIQGLQPASTSCKEVTDFVMANSDPLIPTSRKKRRSSRFWKWLWGIRCFNFSWICCCCSSGCSLHQECPSCCECNLCNCCSSCISCPTLKWRWCCSCPRPRSHCCRKISCSRNCCCICQLPACPDCSCSGWTCSCPECPKVRLCCNCKNTCCNPCLFF